MYASAAGVRQVLAPEGSADPTLGTAAALPDDAIEEAIAEADAQIDGRLASRYSVPFDPVPGLVERLSRDIAAYLATLTYRRNSPIAADDPVRLRHARAQQMLDQAARGDLEIATDDTSAESEAHVVNRYQGEMFSLEDFSLGTGNRSHRHFAGLEI